MTGPVVIPGLPGAAETAVLPVQRGGPCGLFLARMTDVTGADLYWGWVPAGTRLVARGQRVFAHWQGNEWRQVPVVLLGEDGRPV